MGMSANYSVRARRPFSIEVIASVQDEVSANLRYKGQKHLVHSALFAIEYVSAIRSVR